MFEKMQHKFFAILTAFSLASGCTALNSPDGDVAARKPELANAPPASSANLALRLSHTSALHVKVPLNFDPIILPSDDGTMISFRRYGSHKIEYLFNAQIWVKEFVSAEDLAERWLTSVKTNEKYSVLQHETDNYNRYQSTKVSLQYITSEGLVMMTVVRSYSSDYGSAAIVLTVGLDSWLDSYRAKQKTFELQQELNKYLEITSAI